MMNTRKAVHGLGPVIAVAVLATLAAPVAYAAPEQAPQPAAGQRQKPAAPKDDFNGDGYTDVAVAAPGGLVKGVKAGYVAVMYGSASKPPQSNQRIIHENTPGFPGTSEEGDRYGSGLATGDLNGDGYTDLVVGVPGESLEATERHGSWSVVWGGPDGLATSTRLLDDQGKVIQGGGAVATGDFNGDGAAEVVIPGILVFSGPFGQDGRAAGQTAVDLGEGNYVADLVSGDLNDDGIADLAAAFTDIDTLYDGGSTAVWHGSASGLGARVFSGYQGLGGVSVDIGDIDRDGIEDLVVGRPRGEFDSAKDIPHAKGGMVTWIPGSAGGPVASRALSLNQDSPGVPGTAEDDTTSIDGFGSAVSVGDIDGDGFEDVSAGVPGEMIGSTKSAGTVTTLRGGAQGLTGAGAKVFSQDTEGVPGTPEQNDRFGDATRLADVDGDGRAELFVSAVWEDTYAGAVWLFDSTASGVTAAGSVSFGAKALGMVADRESRLGAPFSR
ncbi:FG-GAP-like repeat-containing protein [Streptomyces jumonjinensis]|uniref:FG-GAP-like repeat-containing protein n=1 Tax=Streptomyces jumonjinensis TaxID=1945 RepID=UPI0037965B09